MSKFTCYIFVNRETKNKNRVGIMQNLYQEIEAVIIRILNCYTNLQRSKHEYCPGISLYPSEIHAIECIATLKKINLTELASQLGLTKGATSKLVAKLEKEGLLRRYRYVNNQKEIYFHLTDVGVQAYKGHKLYHADMARVMEEYCNNVPGEIGDEILKFINIYLEQMQKLP